MANKQISYTAERADELLRIVDGLGEATITEAGLMSAEDKAKLDSVEDGAEENVIVGVQVGGSALTPADKVVNIPADSAPTSESTNLVRSGGVYTAIQQVANALLNYYTKTQVDALLAGVHQFTYQVVAELPDASADTMYILYFVPSSDPQTQNVKDEYITIRTGSEGAYAYSWERIGSTEIDLSDYPTTEEMSAAIATAVASKADKDDDAVEGNLAKFDANGNPVDTGVAAEKVAKKGEVQTFAGNLVDTRSAGTRQGPFAFRQSGGDGVNYMRKILGRTEVFNQLKGILGADGSKTENGVTIVDNRDGSYTVSTDQGGATAIVELNLSSILIASHRYLIKGCPAGGSASTFCLTMGAYGADYGSGVIITNLGSSSFPRIRVESGAIISTPVVFRPMIFDLTLEGLGFTTADQFRALHSLPYYNYNAGVLKNNAATGLETTGFNAYDPASGKAQIINGQQYQITGTYTSLSFDGEAVAPDGSGVFTAPGTGELSVVGGNSSDTCVHLVGDGSRNGEYEPYWKRDIVLGLDNLACHDEDDNAVVVNGLDGVGTSQDELIVENGWGTKIIKRRGRRAYQAGDESDATLMTDGTNTDYPLATPKVLTLDNPIPALIEVDNLGTERRLPEDTADNPQAPFECDSNYSISVANLVRKLNS